MGICSLRKFAVFIIYYYITSRTLPLQHKCHSDTNAMVFVNNDQEYNYVTTRDLNLEVKDVHPILEESFDGKEAEG